MAGETRARIVDAAADVMRSRGVGRTTTKEIARAAGFSEATLYKHFESKEDLFLEVLRTRLPPLFGVLRDLPAEVGVVGLRERLERVALEALAFYEDSMPMSVSLLSSPELLSRHREGVHARGAGPHVPVTLLADHLRAEQEAGNLAAAVSADAAAQLLLGACFQQAFLTTFSEVQRTDAWRRATARDLVDVLLGGIADPVT